MSDWEFIFDGVFGFLTSPLWEVPMMSFIETQSIVFEPSEENFSTWSEIHNKYKSLVESLLSSYLKDVGITEQQFMKACGSPSARSAPAMQPVYEQLWATEDYEIFKRMMIQRNVELQLQALELIRKRQGGATKKAKDPVVKVSKSEEEILAEVMKKSEEEYNEAQQKKNDVYDPSMEVLISQSEDVSNQLEKEVLKTREETKQTIINGLEAPPVPVTPSAISQNQPSKYDPAPLQQLSPKPSNVSVQKKPSAVDDKEKQKEEELREALKNASLGKPAKAASAQKPGSDAAAKWMDSEKEEKKESHAIPKVPISSAPSNDELKKRSEYLKQQRDRLLALKKEEREKKLNDYSKTQSKRPTSARVAKQAVSGVSMSSPAPQTEEEKKRMAMRKALAEKLKKEVVYK